MIKNIKIGNKDIKLDNCLEWTFVYRDQFGKDIIPTLMPAMAAATDVMSGLIAETGKTKDVTVSDLLEIVDGDYLINAVMHLGGLELMDLIELTWCLAKVADDSIPEPRAWARSLGDNFPVDEVAPVVIEMIFKSSASSKLKRRVEGLINQLRTIKESSSTPLSSPDSNED